MPRERRVEYAGGIYHVMARGNRRGDIVLDDDDRRRFVETLVEVVESSGWVLYGWVLMSNHYHFLFQTPEPNLVQGMSWFQNTWTRRSKLEWMEGCVDWRETGVAGDQLPDGQSLQATFRRRWYFGSEEFREKLLKLLGREEGRLAGKRRSGVLFNGEISKSGSGKKLSPLYSVSCLLQRLVAPRQGAGSVGLFPRAALVPRWPWALVSGPFRAGERLRGLVPLSG